MGSEQYLRIHRRSLDTLCGILADVRREALRAAEEIEAVRKEMARLEPNPDEYVPPPPPVDPQTGQPPAHVAPPLPPRDAQDELAAQVAALTQVVAELAARQDAGGGLGASTAAQRAKQDELEQGRLAAAVSSNAQAAEEIQTNKGGFRGAWGQR